MTKDSYDDLKAQIDALKRDLADRSNDGGWCGGSDPYELLQALESCLEGPTPEQAVPPRSKVLADAINAAKESGDDSEVAFQERLDDGKGSIKPFPPFSLAIDGEIRRLVEALLPALPPCKVKEAGDAELHVSYDVVSIPTFGPIARQMKTNSGTVAIFLKVDVLFAPPEAKS